MADFTIRSGVQDQKERGRYVVSKAEYDAKAAATKPAVFCRIGEGFSETNETLNPQTKTSNYVNGKSSSTVNAFQESVPVSGERYVGDPANDLFAKMAEMRAKGPDATVILVTVNFYEESTAHPGIFRAFRQPGSYSPESAGGGSATDPVSISGTVNLSGTPTEGFFLPNGKPDADFPELELRDRGIFSTDLDELAALIDP